MQTTNFFFDLKKIFPFFTNELFLNFSILNKMIKILKIDLLRKIDLT